jgi:hypothetical protein
LSGNVGWAGGSAVVTTDNKVGAFFLQCNIAPLPSGGSSSSITEVIITY